MIRETLVEYSGDNMNANIAMLTYGKRQIIETSFFGLEPGLNVPPNVTFTGPLCDSPKESLPDYKCKD